MGRWVQVLMDHDKPAKPNLSATGRRAVDERRQRQAAALRANLARRKARGRALEEAGDAAPPAPEPTETKAVSPGPGSKPGKA